jgi:hypothetical protein
LLATDASAAPVVFIVRHAEKASTGGKDPDLSVQGQKRADALAHILKDSQIASVFVTEFKRTQETAAPTAKAAQVSPTVVPANDIGALVEKLRALNGNAPSSDMATRSRTCSKRLGSQRRSAFLRTIIPKSLPCRLAMHLSCCGCIIRFDKDPKSSRAEKFCFS